MPRKVRNCLSLNEKMHIIEQLKKGTCVTSLAKKYNVAKSTICNIRGNSSGILKAVNSTFVGPGKRKVLRRSELPRMEKALYHWFLNQRDKNLPVNGQLIKVKAKMLHAKIKENDSGFNASDGWLQRFKSRFGIRFIKICGEKLSAQPELVEPFKLKLQKLVKELGLSTDQIYNADESGLFWKLLPEKTYVSASEKVAPGRKSEKQRVTFLACTNASGSHKVKMLVIGKAKNPRAFKNFVCPLEYKSSPKAWMTSNIFLEWFHKSFVKQVRQFSQSSNMVPKALLLLDNAPSHPPAHMLKSSDGLISAVFMPPNVTCLIQPMDQNIIRITKLYYRTSLLTSVIAKASDPSKTLKNLTLKDAVVNLHCAWNRLEKATIAKCWKPILSTAENLSEDDIPLSILRAQWNQEITVTISETSRVLNSICSPGIDLTTEDIDRWNNDIADSDQQEDDEEDEGSDIDATEGNERQKISAIEAIQAMNKAIEWAADNSDNFNDVLVLRKLREKAVLKTLSANQIQAKISNYFQRQVN